MQNFIQNPYPSPKPPEHEKFIKLKPTWENQPRKIIKPPTQKPPTQNFIKQHQICRQQTQIHHQQHRIHLVEAQFESRSIKQYRNDHWSPPRSNPKRPSPLQQKWPPQPLISTSTKPRKTQPSPTKTTTPTTNFHPDQT